jgi:hypothetical protein
MLFPRLLEVSRLALALAKEIHGKVPQRGE